MNATLSPDGTYRYTLERTWIGDGPADLWIMLNPSTADAAQDDPTVRRCMDFSKRWGASGLVVVNLFALRSTNPAALLTHPDPVGPDNDYHLRTAALDTYIDGGRIVCAWGTHPAAAPRALHVAEALTGMDPQCLGTTRGGSPRHPLYVRGDTPLVPWSAAA